MIPVGLLGPGERGEIVAIREGGGKCDCRIEGLGLRVGKSVEMLTNGGGASDLFYRSFWEKKGGCHDCNGCSCGRKK